LEITMYKTLMSIAAATLALSAHAGGMGYSNSGSPGNSAMGSRV